MSLVEEFDRAVEAAGAQLDDRDKAAIALTRMLARKIDSWMVIVEWAEKDADDQGGRPAVPQNDNVSMSAFLKALDALGLTPMSRKTIEAARFAKPTTEGAPSSDDDSDEAKGPARVTSAEDFRSRAASRRPT